MTVQGHPEFDEQIEREILKLRNDMGVIPDDTYTEALGRVADKHDGMVAIRAFLRFLLDDSIRQRN